VTLPADEKPTETLDPGAPAPAPAEPGLGAGTILAGRFRIEGLLGRGGMGEVYRAEDLKLRQPVALKFLPRGLEADPEAFARLLEEVRSARQVTHPNVCRVHDIMEAGDRHFLAMEYIDGEDLSCLLRRVGRLTQEKGLTIARQVTAALAAVHAKGILHRDLKPANVMIDGRGEARLADFGLAAASASPDRGRMAGTPAYMPEEVLAGGAASVRSDLFALGLVLYEIFTGKRGFEATTLEELRRLHRAHAPTAPSRLVPGLDPALERIILQCLALDPADRPPSALAVLASLPGGDPLAALVAAGETPSPRFIADAGGAGTLTPARAWATFALLALVLPAAVWLMGRVSLLSRVRLDKSPAALVERAQQILAKAGHESPVVDASGKWLFNSTVRTRAMTEPSPERLAALASARPPLVEFHYRVASAPLNPSNFVGEVLTYDPAPIATGMANMRLDPQGRLVSFQSVLPLRADEPVRRLDWGAILAEAGLDMRALTPAQPLYYPRAYATSIVAWEQGPLRVEASERNGRLTSFTTMNQPELRQGPIARQGSSITWIVSSLLINVILYVLPLALVLRNWRRGRIDLPGANKVAAFSFVCALVLFASITHHGTGVISESYHFAGVMAHSFLRMALIWLCYLALEPMVRRHWPDSLISWSRVLAGRFRDPRVGRDLLVGLAAGWGAVLVLALAHLVARRPFLPALDLGDVPAALVTLSSSIISSMDHALAAGVLLFILRLLTRRMWLAVPLFLGVAAVVLANTLGMVHPLPLDHAVGALWGLAAVGILMRFGLFALVAFFLPLLTVGHPLGLDLASWQAGSALLVPLLTALLGIAGFVLSVGGQPLFGPVED